MSRYRVGLALCVALAGLVIISAGEGRAEGVEAPPPAVPLEEYPLFDVIVESKFLTSQTELVIIERRTATRLTPDDEDPPTEALFEERQIFGGRLPRRLVSDFLFKMQRPSRLEGRFAFRAKVRFSSNGVLEEPELSRFVRPAHLAQAAPSTIGVLSFSRVGFTPREDQALVYVAEERPDGTGAGMMVRLHRRGTAWTVGETDVLWVAR
jgi:hypothetical protein